MLLDKYSDKLANTAKFYVSDHQVILDILQETWISIFNNIQAYEEKGLFFGWAKKIMLREVFKNGKKESAKIKVLNDLPKSLHYQQPSIEGQIELQEALVIVNKLKSPGKEVFKMHVIDGLKHKEIAFIMSISESTSRVHLTNARIELNELFAKREHRKIKV